MNATSTSTAGMAAPTSTRNGACFTPRPSLPVTAGQLLLDARGQRRRLLEVLGLGHVPQDQGQVGAGGRARTRRHSPRPPERPRGGSRRRWPGRTGSRPRCRCAPWAAAGVGVDRDEQVGLVVVGEGGALVERDLLVLVARQEGLQAELVRDRRAQLARDRERDVLLERAARALGADLVAAVAGVDDDRAQAGSLGRAASRGRARGARSGDGELGSPRGPAGRAWNSRTSRDGVSSSWA